MARPLLYISAVVVVACLVATTLKVTAHSPKAMTCPRCGREMAAAIKHDAGTIYECPSCRNTVYGPPRQDFSWVSALESLLP